MKDEVVESADVQDNVNTHEEKEQLDIPEIPKNILAALVSEDGSINEEAMQKHKLPSELKPIIEAGIKAQKNEIANKLYGAVGGKDTYTEMMQWAASNLDAEAKAQYNELLKTNLDAAKLAAKGIFAEYSQATKGSKALKQPDMANPNSGVQGFATHSEFLEAQRDPKYKKDPDYRNAVLKRVQNSPWFKTM